MSSIVIVPHRFRPEAGVLAQQAIDWLVDQGHNVRVSISDNEQHALANVDVVPETDAGQDAALAISIGGDGTMLHAIDMVTPFHVPVLGINAGHLGYLTATPADKLQWALEQFFTDEYQLEERMTLDVTVISESIGEITRAAFNEVVVEKTVAGHTVHLAVEIGGHPFLTYAADGMIVATPSGSTAYNLSARGPIVSPHLRAIVLTPVSPHMLFDRSLVVRPEEFIEVLVLSGREANLVVDGTLLGVMHPGDRVRITEGKIPAQLVTFTQRDVHTVLRDKFGLADR